MTTHKPTHKPTQNGSATLWLIPLPLGASSSIDQVLTSAVILQIDPIQHFVVETAKTARAFLKPALTGALQDRHWYELNQRTHDGDLPAMLAPLLAGNDVGLVSDAGCPGVADPGAKLVAAAHDAIAAGAAIKVRPLIGPSSLLLALMASGMNGQQFAFVGYLPSQPEARKHALLALQARSAKAKETILMIETPYRSKSFLETALGCLASSTRFMAASQLTLPDERIISRTLSQWHAHGSARAVVEQAAEPTVFALLA